MRILFYADLHFSDRHAAEALVALDVLAGYIKQYEPELLVNLGDTFHTKDAVTTWTLDAAARGLTKLHRAMRQTPGLPEARPHWAISGNHDVGDRVGIVSAARIMELAGIEVFSGGEVTVVFDGTKVAFLSYIGDPVLQAQAIEKINQAEPDLVFAHLPISGAKFNPTKVDEDPSALQTRRLNTRFVIAGHYHHPQVLESGRVKTYIVGSPCYHTWGDQVIRDAAGDVLHRGFLLMDYTPALPHETEFTWLPNTRAKIRHTIHCDGDLSLPEAELRDVVTSLPKLQQAAIRVVGAHARDFAESQAGILCDDVKLTLSSAVSSTTLPDEPDVDYVPSEIDPAPLLDRVLAQADFGDVPVDRVRKMALSLLIEVGNETDKSGCL